MCTQQRWITNKYNGQKVLVKCGHCPACLQEKANRYATNIRRHGKQGETCYFLTFTYKNEFVPYIDKNDKIYFEYVDGKLLPCLRLLRDSKIIRYYDRVNQKYVEKVKKGPFFLDWIPIDDNDCTDLVIHHPILKNTYSINLSDIYDENPIYIDLFYLKPLLMKLPYLNGDCNFPLDFVGVSFFKDIQNFYKRLFIYLKRHYNYDTSKLSYFNCSEYGETYYRPHFHSLLWAPISDHFILKSAVVACWSFSNHYQRNNKMLQRAKAPARYVSGYVTKHYNLHEFFRKDKTRQKFSTSKLFNFSLSDFSPEKVYEHVITRNLKFTTNIIRKGGTVDVATLFLPKYVVNRYFPFMSGHSRLAPDEMEKYLYKPFQFYRDLKTNNNNLFTRFQIFFPINYKNVLHHAIVVFYKRFYTFVRKCRKWANYFGLALRDYVKLHYEVWTLYRSERLKYLHENVDSIKDYFIGFYDNIQDYYEGLLDIPFLDNLMFYVNEFVGNPNEFPRNVEVTNLLQQQYLELKYQRSITDYNLELSSIL